MEIKLNAVNSSQIMAIGHDAESNTMAVQFKHGDQPGPVYHYSNVTPEFFADFAKAESIGSFFYKWIKPKPDVYPFVKVGSVEAQPTIEVSNAESR